MFYKKCGSILNVSILYAYLLNFNYAYLILIICMCKTNYKKVYIDIKIHFRHYTSKLILI